MLHVELETRKHLYIDCYKVRTLWLSILHWWFEKTGEKVVLTNKLCLLGTDTNDNILNKLLLIARIEIYQERKNYEVPHINHIIKKLLSWKQLELFQAKKRGKYDDKLSEWSIISTNHSGLWTPLTNTPRVQSCWVLCFSEEQYTAVIYVPHIMYRLFVVRRCSSIRWNPKCFAASNICS